MKTIRILLCLAVLIVFTQCSAWAGPITTGIWYEFWWDSGTGNPSVNVATSGCTDVNAFCPQPGDVTFADDPPWTFTAISPGYVFTITDVALGGDAFNVFDFGSLILATTVLQDNSYACNNGGSLWLDPANCVSDAGMSHGRVLLAPGPHSITITARIAGSGDGIADFRIDPAPEPAFGFLTGGILVAIGSWKRFRSA
jgi:hypothetical protein